MAFPKDDNMNLEDFFNKYVNNLYGALNSLDIESLEHCYDALIACINSGSRIFTCGNGGSSAIAEHMVCDFVKQASTDSSIEPKVHALLSTPILTAIANDYSYDQIFSFQLERYAESSDLLLSISSSGNSENIVKAIETAKLKNMMTISFVGFDGGKVSKLSDVVLHLKAENYGIVEDSHQALMHILSQYLRLKAFKVNQVIDNVNF